LFHFEGPFVLLVVIVYIDVYFKDFWENCKYPGLFCLRYFNAKIEKASQRYLMAKFTGRGRMNLVPADIEAL